jgi:hypothetical protein
VFTTFPESLYGPFYFAIEYGATAFLEEFAHLVAMRTWSHNDVQTWLNLAKLDMSVQELVYICGAPHAADEVRSIDDHVEPTILFTLGPYSLLLAEHLYTRLSPDQIQDGEPQPVIPDGSLFDDVDVPSVATSAMRRHAIRAVRDYGFANLLAFLAKYHPQRALRALRIQHYLQRQYKVWRREWTDVVSRLGRAVGEASLLPTFLARLVAEHTVVPCE